MDPSECTKTQLLAITINKCRYHRPSPSLWIPQNVSGSNFERKLPRNILASKQKAKLNSWLGIGRGPNCILRQSDSVVIFSTTIFSLQCPWHQFTCSALTRFAEKYACIFGLTFAIYSLRSAVDGCRRLFDVGKLSIRIHGLCVLIIHVELSLLMPQRMRAETKYIFPLSEFLWKCIEHLLRCVNCWAYRPRFHLSSPSLWAFPLSFCNKTQNILLRTRLFGSRRFQRTFPTRIEPTKKQNKMNMCTPLGIPIKFGCCCLLEDAFYCCRVHYPHSQRSTIISCRIETPPLWRYSTPSSPITLHPGLVAGEENQ